MTAVLTALVLNWLIFTAVALLFGSKGAVAIGDPTEVSGVLLREVEISNWRKEPLNGVLLAVPSGVGGAQLSCAQPLEIVEVPGVAGGASRRLRLSGVAPESVAKVLVAVPRGASRDSLAVVNAEVLGLGAGDQAPEWWRLDPRFALPILMNCAFFGIMVWQYRGLKEEVAESRRSMDSAKAAIDSHSREVQAIYLRHKLLLVARISAYRRELDFWRDAVRQILYKHGSSKADREGFLRGVSDALKTQLTNASKDRREFDELVVLAEAIAPDVLGKAAKGAVGAVGPEA
jgi:hypothetical protein